ncbi:MAG TPA: glycoside hydrolase family 95 protein [Pyrinomonadaceae bacterium]|nr:glycoside hydrolase family 95 protein [Pyrinomonadaceae bacterium]
MKKELTADKHRYTQILRNDMGLQISNFNFKKSAFICVYLWIIFSFSFTNISAQERKASLGVDSFSGSFASESIAPNEKFSLWYRRPAENWDEALPIGNGRLGAMIFGGIEGERIQLNEDTLWSGSPYNPNNSNALAALPEVRKLVFDGKYTEAAKLINAKMMAIPLKQMALQTVGDLRLAFPKTDSVSNYRRELNIADATAKVSYKIGDTTFTREIFSSAVDNVIVIKISADKKGKVNFSTAFQSPQNSSVFNENGNTLILSGTNGSFRGIQGKLKFQSRAKIINQGGKLSNVCAVNSALSTAYSLSNTGRDQDYKEKAIAVDKNNCLSVENADSATILISAATSFIDYKTISGDEKAKSKTPIETASKKSFETLKKSHVADYRKFYDRVLLDFGTTDSINLPTDERIKNFANGNDPQFAALYFQFGRYLLISSSRPGTQPATLQGIWNDSMTPPWDSKYTININTEMNYWLAEPTNLSELTEPLTQMVADLSETGKTTAKIHYDAKGWVTHHNTDIWRATAPIDGAQWGIWQTGGAWLSTHLWEHYEYSQDRKYLEKIYPILKGASEFFLDFLVQKPGTNYLVTNPSISPENSHPFGTSVADAPMMDSQIIRDLFANTEKASEILNLDKDFRAKLAETRAKLPPNKIGKGGQLQEWFEDWDLEAKEQKHRHVSHLYAAFPSWQINKRDTPEFVEAVKKTLNTRGDVTTGWAIAWRINLWARIGDGERAYKILELLLSPDRTYPNMFDAHPPFQIDGNFGGANAIAEMLVQNRVKNDVVEIELLPALPSKFANGSFKGLRARHGFEIDANWKNGKLVSATIHSKNGEKFKLIYGKTVLEKQIKKGENFTFKP